VVAVAAATGVLAACTATAAVPGAAYASHPAPAGSRPLSPGGSGRSGGSGSPGSPGASRTAPPAALTAAPSPAAEVITTTAPADVTARFARALFRSAPVVIVAAPGGPAVTAAARQARAAHAPLLIAPATASGAGLASLGSAVLALHPVAVLTVALPPAEQAALAGRLPGVRVVTTAAGLPATAAPAPLRGVAVLVSAPAAGKPAAATTVAAVSATAAAAGAAVLSVRGSDPRADPAAVTALARLQPDAVVAVGAGFGPAARLASRVTVAETGRQLPGGGQVLFPGRRLVALYGHPGTPGLGVLGQQDLTASIARARQLAAAYQPLSGAGAARRGAGD
jgi:hypothetical protein